MAFYLESEGHTKTLVNGKVIDNRGYEAISNSKGTNFLIKQNGKKYLLQENNPILNIPANSTGLILRLNNDFLKKAQRKTRHKRKKKKQHKKSRKH